MEITADKIKEAGHWCNQLFVLDQQYRLCKDDIKKQKSLGNKIGQVIFRWFSSIIVVLVCSIWDIILSNDTSSPYFTMNYYNQQ